MKNAFFIFVFLLGALMGARVAVAQAPAACATITLASPPPRWVEGTAILLRPERRIEGPWGDGLPQVEYMTSPHGEVVFGRLVPADQACSFVVEPVASSDGFRWFREAVALPSLESMRPAR